MGATKLGDRGKGGQCVSGGMQATGWIRWVKGAGAHQLGIVEYMVGWVHWV